MEIINYAEKVFLKPSSLSLTSVEKTGKSMEDVSQLKHSKGTISKRTEERARTKQLYKLIQKDKERRVLEDAAMTSDTVFPKIPLAAEDSFTSTHERLNRSFRNLPNVKDNSKFKRSMERFKESSHSDLTINSLRNASKGTFSFSRKQSNRNNERLGTSGSAKTRLGHSTDALNISSRNADGRISLRGNKGVSKSYNTLHRLGSSQELLGKAKPVEKSVLFSQESLIQEIPIANANNKPNLANVVARNTLVQNGISKHKRKTGVKLPPECDSPTRVALFDFDHNWMIDYPREKLMQKWRQSERTLKIVLSEEDPEDAIKARMREVRSMVQPRAEISLIWDYMSEETKQLIKKIADVDVDIIRSNRRKTWTEPLDKLRSAARMCALLSKAFRHRRKYTSEVKQQIAPAAMRQKRMRDEQTDHHKAKDLTKSSLGFDTQLALSTIPENRDAEHLKRVLWVLRATKAFDHLLPAQMEAELARVVAYEKYDDGRVIASQGKSPDRFYYIMTGRIHQVREYELQSGVVNRPVGYLNKGMTTDLEELERQWLREYTLLAKGQVEVLLIERSDFIRLQKTSCGPPLDFLQTLDLFNEFPCQEFKGHADALEYKYYGQNTVIIKDSNRTPWIHVIKSGRVKVVREQNVRDTRTDQRFQSQRTESLGYGRTFSHADAMLGFLIHQRRAKKELTQSLPQFGVSNPFGGTIGCELRTPLTSRKHGLQRAKTYFREASDLISKITRNKNPVTELQVEDPQLKEEPVPAKSAGTSAGTSADISVRLPSITKGPGSIDSDVYASHEEESDDILGELPAHALGDTDDGGDAIGVVGKVSSRRRKSSLPPLISIPIKTRSPDGPAGVLQNNRAFLTREKTKYSEPSGSVARRQGGPPTLQYRRTFLQLDELITGDIFGLQEVSADIRKASQKGLDHMEPALASEGPGVSLVSDGAEVIKVSKRFFLQHAANNTMLKLETMQRDYISVDEARTRLYNMETWNQYKDALMQRTVAALAH